LSSARIASRTVPAAASSSRPRRESAFAHRARQGQAPDAVYDMVRVQFDEKELVELTMAVITINAWDRLNVPFYMPAGRYRSRGATHAVA
jgi:alkylhydroperoxidase family enzyme